MLGAGLLARADDGGEIEDARAQLHVGPAVGGQLLQVHQRLAAGVLADVFHRIIARVGHPEHIELGEDFLLRVLHQHVHQRIIAILGELVGVVVIAQAQAVRLQLRGGLVHDLGQPQRVVPGLHVVPRADQVGIAQREVHLDLRVQLGVGLGQRAEVGAVGGEAVVLQQLRQRRGL